MESQLEQLSAAVGAALQQRKFMLACAESCTGGLIAQIVTATAGSSAWLERGFVTYSNAAKQEMLDVSAATLATQGAVSEAVACEMARGARTHSHAQVSLAVTGIAGPGGGSSDKPVGTVCFAWCLVDAVPISATHHFVGTREEVRKQTAIQALQGLLDLLTVAKTVP